MGFKEWLAKPRLSDEEWRKQMAFVGKGVAIAVAGLWLLLVGTEYLDKRGKQLGRLGQAGPDTSFGSGPFVFASQKNTDYCEISGRYDIKNQGELTFEIEQVEIALFLVRTQKPQADDGNYLFSTDEVLKDLEPIHTQTFEVNERLYPGQKDQDNGNELQRSFGFGVPKPVAASGEDKNDFAYFVTANATGGLPQPNTWQYDLSVLLGLEDPLLTRFRPKDLRMASGGLPVTFCTSGD